MVYFNFDEIIEIDDRSLSLQVQTQRDVLWRGMPEGLISQVARQGTDNNQLNIDLDFLNDKNKNSANGIPFKIWLKK